MHIRNIKTLFSPLIPRNPWLLLHYHYETAFGQRLSEIRAELARRPISEEWRGWHYMDDNLRPPFEGVTVSVSTVTSIGDDPRMTKERLGGHLYHLVPTELMAKARSFVYGHRATDSHLLPKYLRRIGKKTVKNLVDRSSMASDALRGHEISSGQLREITENMIKLWNYETDLLTAKLNFHLTSHRNISQDTIAFDTFPVLMERKVDGRVLGLSLDLSPDCVDTRKPDIVIDMKTGSPNDLDKIGLAGYALAIESGEHHQPVDIGCIEYVSFRNSPLPILHCDLFAISDGLRIAFIEKRNEKLRLREGSNRS